MVQLSTVIAVLAAASLPTAFATQQTDESHLDERSFDGQTALGGALPGTAAPPFHIGVVIPAQLTPKQEREAKLKTVIKQKESVVKARIGLFKQKATKDVKVAKTTIKQVGSQVKLKIGSDLRKGIQKWKEGVRKGEGRLGRHRKFRKFHGKLGRISKHHDVDEFDTEVIIIIKQHAKHRGGRKHHGHGRKYRGHGRKHRNKKTMKQHPSMVAKHDLAMMPMHEPAMMAKEHPSMMATPPMDKSMPMPAAQAPELAAMPAKMVKMPMSKVKSEAMPADPSLGPFFSMGGEPAAAAAAPPPSKDWTAKEMKAEGSMGKPAAVAASALPVPAAAPVDKTVHPVAMPW